jgi:hypothetical protein
MVPLFMPGSWVCKQECDLRLPTATPNSSADEGDSIWASQVLCLVPALECIHCPSNCRFGVCVGLAYSWLDYSERYTIRYVSETTWRPVNPGWDREWLARHLPNHRWRVIT